MSKELLIEYLPFVVDRDAINESAARGGRLLVSGILQRKNAKNQNGRYYPAPILERESGRYNTDFVQEQRALGELDHPQDAQVNLANVSHNILEMWWDGDDLKGKIEILDTPSGNILRSLFKSRIKLGISSRGVGSVKEVYNAETNEKVSEVQDDFELIAFDFVSNPSTQGAYPSPVNESVIVSEKYNYIEIDNIINQIICDIQGICKVCTKK